MSDKYVFPSEKKASFINSVDNSSWLTDLLTNWGSMRMLELQAHQKYIFIIFLYEEITDEFHKEQQKRTYQSHNILFCHKHKNSNDFSASFVKINKLFFK